MDRTRMSSLASENSDPPFFIVGAYRSGTTMLRLMMNAHPRIAVPFESDFIPRIYYNLGQYGDLSQSNNISRLLDQIAENSFVKRGALIADKAAILRRQPNTYPDLIRTIYSMYADARGKTRWGDKDPSYTTEIDVLQELFPDCRVIHIVRDGRGVALSSRGIDWGSKHLPTVARSWQWQVTLAHKMGGMLGERFLEIHYEDLVRQPEATLRSVCRFLGEEFSRDMLHYDRSAEEEMPSDALKYHNTSVSQPDPEKVDMWKREMTRADRILFEQLVGNTLAEFGYEVLGQRPGVGVKLRNFLMYNVFVRQ
jgi:hypothetical protein